MALPLAYYESKLPGDWLQKVSDNEKIKMFLLTNGINIIFSGLSFVVFLAILFFYDLTIGFTVLIFVASYLLWVLAFLKIKKKSEWQYAEISIENQGFWVNTINHFIDYKLNDLNSINIIKWRNNQVKSFKHFFRLNQINGS
jgi:ATP-binding cassette subfamily B protein